MRQTKAFTLVELLVVIAIIGILSSVLIANLGDGQLKARDAKRVSDIKQLGLALELHYESTNTYPAALSSLAPTYIPSIPLDPKTGASYVYNVASVDQSFHLGAVLEAANSQLSEDADVNVVWHGNTTNCTGTSVTSPERCYDIIP